MEGNISRGMKFLLKSEFVQCKKVLSTDFSFSSPEGTMMERIQVQHRLPTEHIQRTSLTELS